MTQVRFDMIEGVRTVRCCLIAFVAWSGFAHATQPSDATGRCADLTKRAGSELGEPTARIVSAKLNAPTAATIDPAAPPFMPPFAPLPV